MKNVKLSDFTQEILNEVFGCDVEILEFNNTEDYFNFIGISKIYENTSNKDSDTFIKVIGEYSGLLNVCVRKNKIFVTKRK